MTATIEDRVSVAVDHWLRWVPTWRPGTHRGRVRLCRKCTGSPFLAAVAMGGDVPHQVTHALVSRMHRIIDRSVDEFTASTLPSLHAELTGEEMWNTGGYDPQKDLSPEYEGLDPDPEPDEEQQPYLFTLTGLAEETRPEPPLPRPPLSAEEKRRLRREVELAGEHADAVGREVCFALAGHRDRVQAAVQRFVEPQIKALLDELSQHLEPPQ